MVEAPSPPISRKRGSIWDTHGAWIAPAVSLTCCLLLWEAAVRVFDVPIYLIPAPRIVAGKLVSSYPLFLQETLHSVIAIIIGFTLAVCVGIPAATLMIYSAWFRRSI